MIKVWDFWVRIFHWLLAILVTYLLISGETGFKFYDWHRNAGEIVLTLLVFRILWGFFGSSTAKLLPLFKPPVSAIRHLTDLLRYRKAGSSYGHNAAGGYATIILLTLIAVQATTGLFIVDEDEFIEGRFYQYASANVADWMHEIHHLNSHVLTAFVFLHIAMIIFYWIYARTNLVKPMITGNTHELPTRKNAPRIEKWWIGCIIAMITGLLYYLVFAM